MIYLLFAWCLGGSFMAGFMIAGDAFANANKRQKGSFLWATLVLAVKVFLTWPVAAFAVSCGAIAGAIDRYLQRLDP